MKRYTVTLHVEAGDEVTEQQISQEIYDACPDVPFGFHVYEVRETTAGKVRVHLFKPSGKHYTEEEWRIPADAIGPSAMLRSPDFRRIGGTGAVLVPAQKPWGFPVLFPGAAQ